MLEAFEITCGHLEETDLAVSLTYDERKKSRHRCFTTDGQELGWFIERGQILKEGDVLMCTDKTTIYVQAANESVSRITSHDTLLLMRGAYHLGNRHVPLQVMPSQLQYLTDHVLDAMVQGLGLTVTTLQAPFNPENGAYVKGGHHHHHQ